MHRAPTARPEANRPDGLTLVRRRDGVDSRVPLPGAALLAGGLLLAAMGAGAVAGGGYLAFRDEMLARLVRHQAAMQFAYEDQLAAARARIDRFAARQVVDQEGIEGQVDALIGRQARLETRHALVASLAAQPALQAPPAARAEAPRPPVLSGPIGPGAIPGALGRAAVGGPALPAGASAFAASPRTRPEPEEAGEPARDEPADPRAPLRLGAAGPLLARVALAGLAASRIEAAQERALEAIEARARVNARRWAGALAETGLAPSRFAPVAPAAVGGPFVPLGAGAEPFERRLGAVQSALLDAERARRALRGLPLGRPLGEGAEITSPYGSRLDPFLRQPALHAGVDFRAPTGTPVRAAAAGRVSEAGWAGGYGNMVEVEHEGGVATRYGHLSGVDVAPGQAVAAGALIGRAGSTGRSTAPHLHYEVRVDGEAVDPMRFLRAGQRLAER